MERTLSLNEQDFQVLDQIIQIALRAADIRGAKHICALHTKIEGQLTAQNNAAQALATEAKSPELVP